VSYLRQDLERVRSLTDLVRKREKKKLERLKLQQRILMLMANPLIMELHWALDEFAK
jgi:hypothetical protein